MILLTVGRVRTVALAMASVEYERRIAGYWKLELRDVKEERGTDPAFVRRQEGKRLIERLEGMPFVACHEGGRTFTSAEFARWMGESRDVARLPTFVIGGAFGLDEEVRSQAAFTLSLAPWTLPHELARVVLLEQLYRAGTILRGEPYHK